MSGPKCFDIITAPLGECRRDNRRQCDRFLSEYRRYLSRLSDLIQRLTDLGLPCKRSAESAEGLEQRVANIFRNGAADGLQAVEMVLEAKRKVEKQIETHERTLEMHLREMQAQHRSICDRVKEIERYQAGIRSIRDLVPTSWPEEVRVKLINEAEQLLSTSCKIHPPQLEFTAVGADRLRDCERESAQLRERLSKGLQLLEKLLHESHVSITVQKLTSGLAPAQKLKDLVAATRSAATTSPAEEKIFGKLDNVLAQIAVLRNVAARQDLATRIERIRSESDAAQRRTMYDALLIDCSTLLRQWRDFENWKEQAEALMDSAAHVSGADVQAIKDELGKRIRAGTCADLNDYRARLSAAVAEAERRQVREERRRAVLDSLMALGYEVETGMETALVSGGKVYMRKPPGDEYAIEIVADATFSTVQTAMVRFADNVDSSEQQRLRDKEHEEAWCGDHGHLVELLQKNGLDANFRLKLAPGERAVRVVVDAKQQRRRESATRGVNRIQSAG